MDIETRAPLINSPDARKFFGVGDSIERTEHEKDAIRNHFESVCMRVLASAPNGHFAANKATFSSLPDELVSPQYSEGNIQVAIGMRSNEQGFDSYDIIVTYSTEVEEEGEVYDAWQLQSTFRVDDAGQLVRKDRTPPTPEDDELMMGYFDNRMALTAQLFERHQEEIRQLSQQLSEDSSLNLFELQEKIEAALSELQSRHRAELEKLNALFDSEKENNTGSNELLVALGMNDQPVGELEFRNLLKLVDFFYSRNS